MSRERELLSSIIDMLERSNAAHLNYSIIDGNVVYADDLIKAANECLSNPLPNPVAWMKKHENGVVIFSLNPAEESDFTPLYAEPPASKLLTESSQDRTKKYFSHEEHF